MHVSVRGKKREQEREREKGREREEERQGISAKRNKRHVSFNLILRSRLILLIFSSRIYYLLLLNNLIYP